MPSGRPPKRPGDSEVNSTDGHAKSKQPRTDRGSSSNDFSSVVKSKLQSYTRTGQACDRCKVRKIRCDALPEGCSHCVSQNLECYVTDRVTGRTERRGYLQELEREKTDMLNHIRDLEKLLGSAGVEVKPWGSPDSGQQDYTHTIVYENTRTPVLESKSIGQGHWTQVENSVWVKNYQPKSQMTGIPEPTVETKPVDVHLGVTADRAMLSSIKGTTLSILGSTIDIGSFAPPDTDGAASEVQRGTPMYNTSVQAMIQSVLNVNPRLQVEYPPRDDAFNYAEWYFQLIYPFVPILHKPTFMNILTRIYDDPSFRPTVAEVTMVHMVYASIYFQYGLRNPNTDERAQFHDLSNKHYHFALGNFFELVTSRKLEDIQALTLVATHTRAFPKPDCSSMLINYCLSMAIGLGLHRRMKKPGEETNLENEIRKRTWWIVLGMAVTLYGRLGRPMPVRLSDVEVDFPEMIADELLTPEGVDKSRTAKCPYECGVAGNKMAALLLDMYANLYCAKRDPNNYLRVVEDLEARLRVWKDELPPSLRSVGENENQMLPLWAKQMELELRLCVRHPSVAMTTDAKVMAENTRLCEETATEMLDTTWKLHILNSLDTTLYGFALDVAALFTTLMAHWERRHGSTVAEIESLRKDMNKWLVILGEIGTLMGAGSGPRDAVSDIIDRTIAWIDHDRQQRAGTLGQTPTPQDLLSQPPQTSSYPNPPRLPQDPTSNQNGAETSNGSGTPNAGAAPLRQSYYQNTAPESTAYPPLGYNEQPSMQTSSGLSYDTGTQYLYAQATSHAGGGQAQAQPQTQVHIQAQSQGRVADSNPLSAFAAQATQMAQPDMMWRQQAQTPVGNTWQDWTAAVVDNQDRYSANALMSLGGGGPRTTNIVNDGSNTPDMAVGVGMNSATGVSNAANTQWPLMLFHDGTGVDGG